VCSCGSIGILEDGQKGIGVVKYEKMMKKLEP
jgi:hypothetical protein